MTQIAGSELEYSRLKRTAIIGYAGVFAWYGIVGGIMSISSDSSFGWVTLFLGVAVLALPFISAVRGFIDNLSTNRGFPALVFIPNILIIIMFAYLASIYFGDPFLTYNDLETLAAVVFGGATLLAVAALAANLVAYLLDRRS